MSRIRFARTLAACVLGTALASTGHAAVVISKDLSNPNFIPGLTAFATTGAMMSGLSVTATFSNGFSQTLAWGTTGADSGGVTGAGWGLSVSGDTFTAPWQFVFSPGAQMGQLISLVLDGSNALTVFDTTDPNQGTPDSASGADFAFIDGCDACNATARYDMIVGVTPNAPVEDLFQRVTITFTGASGPRDNWSFRQDTDNDARFGVPEPGGLALAGLALSALAATARRRRA